MKKWFIVRIAVYLLLAGYAVLIEPYWIEVKQHTLAAPNQAQKIRLVQLSDLHMQSIGKREMAIAERLKEIQPDIIILSGDVIDSSDGIAVLERFLQTLGTAHKIAVLGNHEHRGGVSQSVLHDTYQRHTARLLMNQGASYKVRGRTVYIAGLDDFTAGQPDTKNISPPADADTNILIQHSPGWFEEPQKAMAKFNLCLAGHTHAGQITLFGFALWTPQGSGNFKAGFYDLPQCKLYVSRGIGTSILPIRLGARPEIVVFDV